MKPSEWIDVALLATFALCAVAALATPLMGPTAPRSVTDLALSFVQTAATVAAVVVALYLATTNQRREAAQAHEHASLMAAKLLGRVELLMNAIINIDVSLDFSDSPADSQAVLATKFTDSFSPAMFDFTDDELMGLIPIGEHCAHRLRMAAEALRTLQTQVIQTLRRHATWTGGKPVQHAVPALMVTNWADEIRVNAEVLQVVHRAIYVAATGAAPPPTHEEIYGDVGF